MEIYHKSTEEPPRQSSHLSIGLILSAITRHTTIPNSSANSIKGVRITCLNINSILKHLDEIKIFLDEQKPHIMGLNETNLDSSMGDDEISIEGYSLVRKDRNTHGGCVALYVHHDIPFIKRLDIAYELESISIEVKLPFIKPLIVTTLYPPSPPPPMEYLLRPLILLITCSADLMMKTRNASQSET